MQSVEAINKKMAKVSEILEFERNVIQELSIRERESCVAKKFGINVTHYRELKRENTIPQELLDKYKPDATQSTKRQKSNQGIIIGEEIRKAVGIDKENINNIATIYANGVNVSPTIRDKAIVFVDEANTRLSDAGIYVIKSKKINNNDEVFIRRLILQPNGEVYIICDSDTSEQHNHKAQLDEISILGKVVGVITKV